MADTTRRNVVLITIDALRADHLPFLGYHRNTTPFLNALASQGVNFQLAFSNSSFTWASFPALFTSTYPVQGDKYTIDGKLTLQEVLQENGYTTIAFHSNPYLSRHFGYDKGFDHFEDYLRKPASLESSKKLGWKKYTRFLRRLGTRNDIVYKGMMPILRWMNVERVAASYVNAIDLTGDVLEYVKHEDKRPIFLWVHYMDVHSPPIYPRDILEVEELGKDKKWVPEGLPVCKTYYRELLEKYDYRIRFVDESIGWLYLGLLEMMDDALVVITADHSEEFYDHGEIGHRPKLYDELTHVPLIIKGPGIEPRREESLVQHLDIAPTILDMVGIPVPLEFMKDASLFVEEREGVISEVASKLESIDISREDLQVAYRTKDWKYIYKRNKRDELYNLKEDPREERNVELEEFEIGNKMLDVIGAHLEDKW